MSESLIVPSMQARPRRRVQHVPGDALATVDPEIAEVLDTLTGEHVRIQKVIGSSLVVLMQRRMEVSQSLGSAPLYRCSLCNGPVFISCEKTHTRFFFKHRRQPDNCPAMTRGHLSQEEIRARKYNGAKESEQHRRMKSWLVESLEADGRFTDICVEPTWKGALTGEWRRPDVRAEFDGLPIAFEVQLSTTFLDVIAARRNFYLAQRGLLFWVFSRFDKTDLRMTEEDVFYNNNLNAFVINEKTADHSKQRGRFLLGCHWAPPGPDGEPGTLQKKLVAFDELTRDLERQRVYYFDFESEREAPRKALRNDIEAWCLPPSAYYQPGGPQAWNALVRRLRTMRVEIPDDFSMSSMRLVGALYSLRNGRPWGCRVGRLVQLIHRELAHRGDVLWLCHAIAQYGRLPQLLQEGTPRKLRAKLERLDVIGAQDPAYFAPNRGPQALIEFLFPELLPLPSRWPAPGERNLKLLA